MRKLQDSLTTEWIGKNVVYFDELSSTNDYAKKHKNELESGTIVITDFQKSGRGQYSRIWNSDPCKNLTFSVLIRNPRSTHLHSVTLLSALACLDTIVEVTSERVSLKWPNDIIVNEKKVCGILVESTFTGKTPDAVIIGIGLNVNQVSFDESAHQATSLALIAANSNSPDVDSAKYVSSDNPQLQETYLELNKGLNSEVSNVTKDYSKRSDSLSNDKHSLPVFEREKLLAGFLSHFENRLKTWQIKPSAIRNEVNSRLYGYGEYGKVFVSGKPYVFNDSETFKFMGVNNDIYPVFVTYDGDIIVFKSEQVRFVTE